MRVRKDGSEGGGREEGRGFLKKTKRNELSEGLFESSQQKAMQQTQLERTRQIQKAATKS